MRSQDAHTKRLVSTLEHNRDMRNSLLDAIISRGPTVSEQQAVNGWLEAYARTHDLGGIDVRSVSISSLTNYIWGR